MIAAQRRAGVRDRRRRSSPPARRAGAIRSMVSGVSATPRRGDCFAANANDDRRRANEATLKVVTAYADALMDYTAQLRRDEARSEYEIAGEAPQGEGAGCGEGDPRTRSSPVRVRQRGSSTRSPTGRCWPPLNSASAEEVTATMTELKRSKRNNDLILELHPPGARRPADAGAGRSLLEGKIRGAPAWCSARRQEIQRHRGARSRRAIERRPSIDLQEVRADAAEQGLPRGAAPDRGSQSVLENKHRGLHGAASAIPSPTSADTAGEASLALGRRSARSSTRRIASSDCHQRPDGRRRVLRQRSAALRAEHLPRAVGRGGSPQAR